jgi:hypothetical protein
MSPIQPGSGVIQGVMDKLKTPSVIKKGKEEF